MEALSPDIPNELLAIRSSSRRSVTGAKTPTARLLVITRRNVSLNRHMVWPILGSGPLHLLSEPVAEHSHPI